MSDAVLLPVIGLPACTKSYEGAEQFAVYATYCRVVAEVAGGVPVLLPPLGHAEALLDRIDGLLLTGSESNVEPHHYGTEPSATPGQHDPARDATTLPLIRAAVRRGMPLLAICRGIQELNVALGGTLHQQVHALPGRRDHREQGDTLEQQFAPAHDVSVGDRLAALLGGERLRVNSLHGQAIDRPAPGLAVQATADDGTIEAVLGEGCPGFVLGVQWHPEWHVRHDRPSRAVFAAFGEACRAFAAARGT
jgi:putative glutamine amidotransferase